MSTLNSDTSHLYHDSHFNGLSGGMLEAREHMKAREVNAREARLLRRQDEQLQQAMDTCRKRSRWEQDSVRRDLRSILERTPTFDRTLNDEKHRLQTRQARLLSQTKLQNIHNNSSRPTKKCIYNNGHTKAVPIPAKSTVSSSTVLYHREGIDPRVSSERVHAQLGSVKRLAGTVQQQTLPTSDKDRVQTDVARVMQVKPVARTHKFVTPADQTVHTGESRVQEAAAAEPLLPFPTCDLSVTPTSSTTTTSTNDMLGSLAQYKSAHLRRRSHHAVMAIVRVQARHERRMREADAAMAHAAVRRNRFSSYPTGDKNLTELSKLFRSAMARDEAPHHRHHNVDNNPLPTTRSSGARGQPSKLSWLSLPLSDTRRSAGDLTDGGGIKQDASRMHARPRFYSVD